MTGPAAPPRPPRPPARPPTPPRQRPPRERWSFGRWLRHSARNAALFAVGVTLLFVALRVADVLSPSAAPATPADSEAVATGAGDATRPGAADTAGLFRHAPAIVTPLPRIGPIVVRPPLARPPLARPPLVRPPVRLPPPPHKLAALLRSPQERARGGERVTVLVTQYCLRGLTRLDHEVRDGIVAADPRYFPLGRDVELSVGGIKRRFRVDDTGRLIKGLHLDMWIASCPDARRWGVRFGSAQLVER